MAVGVGRAGLGPPGAGAAPIRLGAETKCVASNTPRPNGVRSSNLKGTIIRVPATGASHISISR
jgi:hypothetical protein